jgi:hypothetical protein
MTCLTLSIVLGIFKVHNVSEAVSASVTRSKWDKDPSQLGPSEGASVDQCS